MNEDLESVYERMKNNKIGWREKIKIGNKLYLVFVRPDDKINEQTEIVFRELLQ
jgi:hypothetical protein